MNLLRFTPSRLGHLVFLTHFLIRGFFIFGTNKLTTLQSCYELILILFGALAVGIYGLITLFVSVKTSDN